MPRITSTNRILPSGNELVITEAGERYIIFSGFGVCFGTIVITPNEFEPGSDEWNNKEIEDYELIKKYS